MTEENEEQPQKRQPWMKWYPADWRSDPKLRVCSLAARGLWADMISLMHEAEPYGHLLINGNSPTPKQLASVLGATERETKTLIGELEIAGVFSRTDNGTVFSRRMVRDRERSEEGRKQVAKRWSNSGDSRRPNRSSNKKPITQKLDARSQRLDGVTESESQTPSVPPTPDGVADYAFQGDTIRLNRADYQKLRKQFRGLNGTFDGEIAKADAYYRDHPTKDGKWWFPLTKWLERAQREHTVSSEENSW